MSAGSHLLSQWLITPHYCVQGMGSLTNASVIAICMAIFQQTGDVAVAGPMAAAASPKGSSASPWSSGTLTASGSKAVLCLTYGFGAIVCIVMVAYRFLFLQESQVGAELRGCQQRAL